jgi:hypothetical protein
MPAAYATTWSDMVPSETDTGAFPTSSQEECHSTRYIHFPMSPECVFGPPRVDHPTACSIPFLKT